MKGMRCLSLVLGALTTAMMLGCTNSPHSEPPDAPPSAPVVGKNPGTSASESPIVTVTPKAAATIRQLLADQKKMEQFYLRVRLIPGGCQGYMHKLDLDPDVSAEDDICESLGVQIITFKRQADMLRGAQVDYVEENGKVGFKVENPNFKGESAKKWLALLQQEKDTK